MLWMVCEGDGVSSSGGGGGGGVGGGGVGGGVRRKVREVRGISDHEKRKEEEVEGDS